MTLRATKPEKTRKKLKAMWFAASGLGKTTAAIQFPKPYILDCVEHGTDHAEYVDKINAAGGAVFHCPDFNAAIEEARALTTEKHDYLTFVVDGWTNLYQIECDRQEPKVGTEYQKHQLEACKVARRLINLALRLDMNFIVTCQSKSEWADSKVVGTTWDAHKTLDRPFDLVLELTQAKKKDSPRLATVRKTRIAAFPKDEVFNFSFQEIAKRFPMAGDTAQAQTVTLASPEQIASLKNMVSLLKVSPETIEKWLAKAEVDQLEDMPAEIVLKCIDHLTSQLKTPTPSHNGIPV